MSDPKVLVARLPSVRFKTADVLSDPISSLLKLQEYFLEIQTLHSEILRLPQEVLSLEERIKAEHATLESRMAEIRKLERERAQLEIEQRSAEDQLIRYKTQQMQVKKTEEYQALSAEIQRTEGRISDLEIGQLEFMEQVEAAESELQTLKEQVARKVAYLKELIAESQVKFEGVKANHKRSELAYGSLASSMEAAAVSQFERLTEQVKRGPYIVALHGQNCGGCHMRVSNDVLKRARMGELVPCDQCARLTYIEA
jgi:uncharacterized protein